MSTSSNVFDPASTLASVLASYAPSPGSFDELLGDDGAVRPAWQPVIDSFARMTSDERKETREMAERLIRQNGVTFLATDEKGSQVRPWRLDMLPMVISPSEW